MGHRWDTRTQEQRGNLTTWPRAGCSQCPQDFCPYSLCCSACSPALFPKAQPGQAPWSLTCGLVQHCVRCLSHRPTSHPASCCLGPTRLQQEGHPGCGQCPGPLHRTWYFPSSVRLTHLNSSTSGHTTSLGPLAASDHLVSPAQMMCSNNKCWTKEEGKKQERDREMKGR